MIHDSLYAYVMERQHLGLIGILIFMLAGRYPKMENKSRKSGQKADVFHLNPHR
jgi:hypothetical protein